MWDRAHGFWKEYVGAASSTLYGVPDADFHAEVAFVGAQSTELFAIRVWVFLCTNRARLQKMVSKKLRGKLRREDGGLE